MQISQVVAGEDLRRECRRRASFDAHILHWNNLKQLSRVGLPTKDQLEKTVMDHLEMNETETVI